MPPPSQAYLVEGPAHGGRGTREAPAHGGGGERGSAVVCVPELLLSRFPSLASPLPAPVSPWVSGGGKAQVYAKLMICLCVKLTGGWTRTQTPLTASQPLCSHPRSPVLAAPCRRQPPPTPTRVAPGPRSTPEPPRAPLPPTPGPRDLRNDIQSSPQAQLPAALVPTWGATVASLGTLSAQGQPT